MLRKQIKKEHHAKFKGNSKFKFDTRLELLLLILNHQITYQETLLPYKTYQQSFPPCHLFTSCLILNKNPLTMHRKSPRSTVMGFYISSLCRAILCYLNLVFLYLNNCRRLFANPIERKDRQGRQNLNKEEKPSAKLYQSQKERRSKNLSALILPPS